MGNLVGGISSGARGLPECDGEVLRVRRASGAHIWSTAGKRYIDTALGFGATILGHSPAAVVQAVQQAVADGSMPAFPHEREEAAATALCSKTGDLSRAVFLNSGSEAVHLACKAARAATGRNTIAKLAAGYDGWFEGMAFGNVLSADAEMRSNTRPARNGTVLLRYHDKADVDALFAENDDIAAIIFEPMMANAGCLVPDVDYLRHLVEVARANGAMVIADEVLMGFRLQAGLSSHLLGLRVDLATVGKAIGSGFAVAALIGTPAAMQVFEENKVVRQGTYNGNAVASAAVIATMAELDAMDYRVLAARGDRLRASIVTSFADCGTEVCTTGYGQVFTLWNGPAAPSSYAEALALDSSEFIAAMHLALRRHGVLSMTCNFGRHYLSRAHDGDTMDALEEAFRKAARDVCA